MNKKIFEKAMKMYDDNNLGLGDYLKEHKLFVLKIDGELPEMTYLAKEVILKEAKFLLIHNNDNASAFQNLTNDELDDICREFEKETCKMNIYSHKNVAGFNGENSYYYNGEDNNLKTIIIK